MSDLITLTTPNVTATFSTFGAALTKLIIGNTDVVLGFDSTQGYKDAAASSSPYFGATIGRFCNRVANGQFKLNGKTYQLAKNLSPNNLHGGPNGFDRQTFTAKTIPSPETPAVVFTYVSPDGDQGFPGQLQVQVKYTLYSVPQVALQIDYFAFLTDPNRSLQTIVNLTNHSYFNLSGMAEPTIERHTLGFPGGLVNGMLELDSNQVPTGKVLTLSSVPEFDFSTPKALGKDLQSSAVQRFSGYDNHYTVGSATVTKSQQMSVSGTPLQMPVVATVKGGKLQMDVATTCPGFQLYTGQWVPNVAVKSTQGSSSTKYQKYGGVCLETSFPPDAINRADVGWDKGVTIGSGETWKHTTVYMFRATA